MTASKERRRKEKETWGKRSQKKKRQSRKKRKKKKTQEIACAMTESCEWRGQIWIFLGATGTIVCRVAWIFCTVGAFQFVRSVLAATLR